MFIQSKDLELSCSSLIANILCNPIPNNPKSQDQRLPHDGNIFKDFPLVLNHSLVVRRYVYLWWTTLTHNTSPFRLSKHPLLLNLWPNMNEASIPTPPHPLTLLEELYFSKIPMDMVFLQTSLSIKLKHDFIM